MAPVNFNPLVPEVPEFTFQSVMNCTELQYKPFKFLIFSRSDMDVGSRCWCSQTCAVVFGMLLMQDSADMIR